MIIGLGRNTIVQGTLRSIAAAFNSEVVRVERRAETVLVAGDESAAQLRLGGEVVMQARLRNAQLRSDVGVAEAVVAAGLARSSAVSRMAFAASVTAIRGKGAVVLREVTAMAA